jgi:hypothetical protein
MTRRAGHPVGVGDFEWKGRKDGLLLVECWCQADMVLVPPEAVRAGLTGSCDAGCDAESVSGLRVVASDLASRTSVARRDSLGSRNESAPRRVNVRSRWPVPRSQEPAP